MITCTSEISGSASRGTRRNDQIPASTRRSVPVKTRNRFRAHQSIHREITLHASRGVHAELLAGNGLPVLLRRNRDLPGSATFEWPGALIESIAFVGESHLCSHGGHAHGGHGGHGECDRDFRARDRSSVRVRKLHAEG